MFAEQNIKFVLNIPVTSMPDVLSHLAEEYATVNNKDGIMAGLTDEQHHDVKQTMLEAKQLPTPGPSRGTSPAILIDHAEKSHQMDHKLHQKSSSSSLEPRLSRSSSSSSIENHARSPVLPIPKTELQDIPEEVRRPKDIPPSKTSNGNHGIFKLEEFASEGLILPKFDSHPSTAPPTSLHLGPSPVSEQGFLSPEILQTVSDGDDTGKSRHRAKSLAETLTSSRPVEEGSRLRATSSKGEHRPNYSSRTVSTPPPKTSWPKNNGSIPASRKTQNPDQIFETTDHKLSSKPSKSSSEPLHVQHLPLPPMAIHTYLQLELSSSRPSSLYIKPSPESEYPYESSKIKFERLLNFLLLPPKLECVLLFGALACLDAWLYTFTILPLRFIKALLILSQWWGEVLAKEFRFIAGFIYHGSGRMWHRQRGRAESIDSARASRSSSRASRPPISATSSSYLTQRSENAEKSIFESLQESSKRTKPLWGRRHHRRTKSQPSRLSPNHKADILQGFVIICSCLILMRFDASRMYHSIRGQAAIKLYVIYNVLEVRLFPTLHFG